MAMSKKWTLNLRDFLRAGLKALLSMLAMACIDAIEKSGVPNTKADVLLILKTAAVIFVVSLLHNFVTTDKGKETTP